MKEHVENLGGEIKKMTNEERLYNAIHSGDNVILKFLTQAENPNINRTDMTGYVTYDPFADWLSPGNNISSTQTKTLQKKTAEFSPELFIKSVSKIFPSDEPKQLLKKKQPRNEEDDAMYDQEYLAKKAKKNEENDSSSDDGIVGC